MRAALYVFLPAEHIGISVAIDANNDIARVVVGLWGRLPLFGVGR